MSTPRVDLEPIDDGKYRNFKLSWGILLPRDSEKNNQQSMLKANEYTACVESVHLRLTKNLSIIGS